MRSTNSVWDAGSVWRPVCAWSLGAALLFVLGPGSAALAAKKPINERSVNKVRETTQEDSLLEPRDQDDDAAALAAKKRAAEHADSIRREAEELVGKALAAEAAGDPASREKLLREALRVDPDCPAAHWQLGELRVGDEWKSIRDATTETSRTGFVREYRNRRDRTPQNADAQFKLARWCGQVGLKEQERAHLVFVLQLQPKHVSASKRLRTIRRELEQLSRQDLELARQQAKEAALAFKEWRPRLVSLRRDAEARDPDRRERGLEGLSAIHDVAALPAIENLFADAAGDVGTAVIKSLAGMDDQRAVDSLVRCSVNAQNADLRTEAAKALGARSMFSYVPTMMSILVPPTRMEYTMAFNSKGDLGYRMTLYQEGGMADVETTHTMTDEDFLKVTFNSVQQSLEIDEDRLRQRNLQTVNMARNIAAANSAREARNTSIAEALRESTGNKLDNAPQSWWNWWLDYNEIYRAPEKPVARTRTESQASLTFSRMAEPPPPPTSLARITHPECFAAGTSVWTMTGPMPIEQVAVGESVLSQNTRTGELGYKLILATTIRPVSPLIVIQAGNETIQATRGHPFWVSGIGWQMAKELKVGQWLHTAKGPVQVKSVVEKGEGLAYNMLLEDFNTYFVTDSMFLVHDNLIREVSPATVPGMSTTRQRAPH